MASRFLHALACGALLLATQIAHALVIEDGMDATATYPFGITDVDP